MRAARSSRPRLRHKTQPRSDRAIATVSPLKRSRGSLLAFTAGSRGRSRGDRDHVFKNADVDLDVLLRAKRKSGREERALDAGLIRDVHSLAVAKRARATLRGEEEIAQRLVHDSGDDLVAVAKRDRNRPDREMLQVIRRAVERVDDPCPRRRAVRAEPAFLAEADVIRPLRGKKAHDRLLALAVGGR